ncbi:uncharacterized protein DSM5745_10262 [Aspergillus mulundensis]|uniref:non-specific serine/threonine protein kinase n=1 Tax=Aspergillus mulundensis TaxID=1810919 RepID=A0A3D8QN57_9EURO|nr:hypothetical protein DSM5745_10262 [Aspergillus mulundensis]RDW63151.1 hypothetical protein DSM5745_10262 [Aspergillus mulundensis]
MVVPQKLIKQLNLLHVQVFVLQAGILYTGRWTTRFAPPKTLEDLQEVKQIPTEDRGPEVNPSWLAVYVKTPSLLAYINGNLEKQMARKVETCEILRRNPHPNIATYYGYTGAHGRVSGLCFKRYTSKLLEAVNLQGLGKVAFRSSARELVRENMISGLDGVLAAIKHLHSLGLAHNDINPANIMVDEDDQVTMYKQYCPPGVARVIASGSSAFIGEVNESTVLKYPLAPGGDMSRLEVEKKLLEIVGPHKRVIRLKGFSDAGLYLERVPNGTLAQYLLESDDPPPSLLQRISWCRETAEAVAWVHSRGVIHCDIQPMNLLLDEGLHVKLSDFQGKHLSRDGTVLLDGLSGEPGRFYCPRADPFDADIKTDLFALGCTIYIIIMGYPVFPDIVDGRFEQQQWPEDTHACSDITLKCWMKEYGSAEELLRDLELVEKDLRAGAAPDLWKGLNDQPSGPLVGEVEPRWKPLDTSVLASGALDSSAECS